MRYFDIKNTTQTYYNTIVMAETLGDAVELHNEETLEGLMGEEFQETGTSSISLDIIEITEKVARDDFREAMEEQEGISCDLYDFDESEVFDGKTPKVILLKYKNL